MLCSFCNASNGLLDTSSNLLLWDSDSEFPLPPSSLCIPQGTSVELMMPPEDERSVPEEKKQQKKNNKKNPLSHKLGNKCTKTVMVIIFRHWPGLEVWWKRQILQRFSSFYLPSVWQSIYIRRTRTHRNTHVHYMERKLFKKSQIKKACTSPASIFCYYLWAPLISV